MQHESRDGKAQGRRERCRGEGGRPEAFHSCCCGHRPALLRAGAEHSRAESAFSEERSQNTWVGCCATGNPALPIPRGSFPLLPAASALKCGSLWHRVPVTPRREGSSSLPALAAHWQKGERGRCPCAGSHRPLAVGEEVGVALAPRPCPCPPRFIRSEALLGGRSRPLPRSHWRRAPVPPRSSRLPARGAGEGAGRDAEEAGAARACGPWAAQHGMRVSRGSLFPMGGGAWRRGGRRWVRGAGERRSGARRGRGAKPRSVPGGFGAAAPGWRSPRAAARAAQQVPGRSRVRGRGQVLPLASGESSHEPSCHGLPHFSDRALEQIARGGGGVSFAGDIPEPSGHSPVPCALG